MMLSERSGLAMCAVVLALAPGPAAGQEIRPTFDKIKETGPSRWATGNRPVRSPFAVTTGRRPDSRSTSALVFRDNKVVELSTKFTGS